MLHFLNIACHGFRQVKQDNYFEVLFDHFLSNRQAVSKIGSSLKSNHPSLGCPNPRNGLKMSVVFCTYSPFNNLSNLQSSRGNWIRRQLRRDTMRRRILQTCKLLRRKKRCS